MTNAPKKAIATLVLAGASLATLVTDFEGTELKPYKDVNNVLTVCNGHTGPDIDPKKTYGKKECDALLVKGLTSHGEGVLRCTKVPLNQNQYDAFTSFAYNVGVGNYCNSQLVKKLNQGDYTGACNELSKWVYAGGKRYRGLENRRAAEKALCLKPVDTPKESQA